MVSHPLLTRPIHPVRMTYLEVIHINTSTLTTAVVRYAGAVSLSEDSETVNTVMSIDWQHNARVVPREWERLSNHLQGTGGVRSEYDSVLFGVSVKELEDGEAGLVSQCRGSTRAVGARLELASCLNSV